MAIRAKRLTPEQEAEAYRKNLRSDIRKFKAARADWIANAKSFGATDERAANIPVVKTLDGWIADAQEALKHS